MKAMYDNYVVIGSKIKVYWPSTNASADTSNSPTVSGVYLDDKFDREPGNLEDLMELKNYNLYNNRMAVTGYTRIDSATYSATKEYKCSIRTLMNDPDYRTDVDADPEEPPSATGVSTTARYFVVWQAPIDPTFQLKEESVLVEIVYLVAWLDPVNPLRS